VLQEHLIAFVIGSCEQTALEPQPPLFTRHASKTRYIFLMEQKTMRGKYYSIARAIDLDY